MNDYKRLTKKDKYGHWYTETKINDRFMWSKDGKVWERDLSHYAFDGEAIDRLAELEDKIENGTLIDLNDIWYEDEEIKSKKRYIICKHYLIKMLVDVADSKAEAEAKLKELREK